MPPTPPQHRALDREFGVPLAGNILDPARWTQTALKKMPAPGPLDWQQLFGRHAPRVVDIGCGNGRFLIGSAVWRPDHDHLGIDVLPLVLRYATRRANQRGLTNLLFAACDGWRLLDQYVAADSLAEVHCYHPQPYHDPGDRGKRLLRPAFLALVHRALAPQGRFFVQTDNGPYGAYLAKVGPRFFEFQEQPRPWPDAPKGRTRREILALRRGLTIWRGWGVKRSALGPEELATLAAGLPAPTFDAGPPPRDLDEEEPRP